MNSGRIPRTREETSRASAAEPPGRGRPRSEEADRAILSAATELLAERGLGGMSMEEAAARAGVGKATVCRRWPSRGALALDGFLAEFEAEQPLPDTGTFRGDLLFGSAYHRLLNGHRPPTDQFARQVVDLIVAGVSAAGPQA